MNTEKEIAELEFCYKKMARIVRDYGDKYLPIFERLHEELKSRKKQEEIKSIALKIALNEIE